jgi:hypothetical protein
LRSNFLTDRNFYNPTPYTLLVFLQKTGTGKAIHPLYKRKPSPCQHDKPLLRIISRFSVISRQTSPVRWYGYVKKLSMNKLQFLIKRWGFVLYEIFHDFPAFCRGSDNSYNFHVRPAMRTYQGIDLVHFLYKPGSRACAILARATLGTSCAVAHVCLADRLSTDLSDGTGVPDAFGLSSLITPNFSYLPDCRDFPLLRLE